MVATTHGVGSNRPVAIRRSGTDTAGNPQCREAVRRAKPRGDRMDNRLTTNSGHVALAESVTAHNYRPLPVVVAEAQGAWVTDVEGRRYLDGLAAYSALNFGNRHPGCSTRPANSWSV